MNKMISACLLATLISVGISKCEAAPRFSIRKVINSKNTDSIHASNSSGWLVFGTYQDEKSSTILIGPNGYQRNLTEVIQNGMGAAAAYPLKVTKDGSVIFIRQELLPSGSYIDTELLKLPFKSTQFERLFHLPSQTGQSRAHDINENGDLVVVDYIEEDPQAGITLTKKFGGSTSSHALMLPNGTPSRKGLRQSITLLLGDSGEIFLARKTYTRRVASLLDICTGHISKATLSCSSRKEIRPLARKRLYNFKFLQAGHVVGISNTRTELINLSDFSTKFKFKTNFRNLLWEPVISDDLGSFALSMRSSFGLDRFTVISQNPSEEKKRMRCLLPVEFIQKLGSIIGLTAVSKDSFYIVVSFQVGTALYEIRREEVLPGGASIPGTCSYLE